MARILVGFDGSPPSRRALEHAVARAAKSGDEIVLVTVIPPQVRESSMGKLMPAGLTLPPAMDRPFEENARARLDEIAAELKGKRVGVRVEVRAGDPAREMLALVGELGVSEIVIGHKAFEGARMTLGPNADAIVRAATVPVTVVP